jgi:hypothetical protein
VSNEIEITEALRTSAEHVASDILDVSEVEVEELAQNDVFVQLSTAGSLIGSARVKSVSDSEANRAIQSFTVDFSSGITYLLHLKAEEILGREIEPPEPADGGEAGE